MEKKKQFLEKITKYKRKIEHINDDILKYKRKRDHVNEDIIKYNKKIAEIDQQILNDQIQLIHSQINMSIDSYNQPPSIFEEVRPSIPNESPDIKPDLVAVVPPSSSDNSDSDSDTDSEYSDDKMQSIQEAVAVSKMQNNKNNSTVKPTKKEKPSKLPITKATHSSSSSSSSSKPSLRSRSSSAVNYNFLNNNISLPSTPLVTSSAPLFVASQSPYKVNVEEGSLSKLWITDASGYSNLTQPLRCMTQFRNVDQKVLVAGSNTGTIEVYDLDVGKGMIKFQTNYIINNDSNAFVDDVDLDCTEQYCIATIRAKQGFTAKSSVFKYNNIYIYLF